MNRLSQGRQVWCALSAFVLCAALTAGAASGTWNSTVPGSNGFWTNSFNWSASPYPKEGEVATFDNPGNGQTTLDVAGLSFIKFITFDLPGVAAYTIGTGAANSQTLVLGDGGEIKLSSAAGAGQAFNCGVQLGHDKNAQSYSLRNDNAAHTLTFNDVAGCAPEVTSGAGTKTLTFNGAGNMTVLGNVRPNGASGLNLTHANNGTLTLAGTNAVGTLTMNGGPLTLTGTNAITAFTVNSGKLTLTGSNVITTLTLNGFPSNIVDIGDGYLFLNNTGATVLQANRDTLITGTGKIRLSTNTDPNYADVKPVETKTLIINPELVSDGGFELNDSGTVVLNGTNTFTGNVYYTGARGTISVFSIGNKGSTTSNLGKGTKLMMSQTDCRLLYTGLGETSDRVFELSQGNFIIEQAGPGGTLKFSASPTLTSGAKNLTLRGATAGVGEFSAPLVNSSGTLALTKAGEGTWILSGASTYTGATAVNGGKLLVNAPGSLAAGSAVAVGSGAILGGNGTVKGVVTLAAGGLLAPADINAAGTLNLSSNLVLNGSTLLFDVSNVATDKLAVARTLTLNGTNTVVVSFPSGTAPAGTYTLMTFASLSGTGSFVLSPAYVNATLVPDGTSLKLVVVDTGAYSKTWTGNASANWNETELNWTNGSDAVTFAQGDSVAFDDTASGFTVDGASPVAPGAVLFNNSANNYAVSAAIDGTGVVYKLGSGAVTLSGNNTYTGQTTLVGGTLAIGGAGVLGGGNYTNNFVNNGALIYASSVAQTNGGVISGGGSLVSGGNGLLVLSGNNTYSGPTTVTGGVLKVTHANALGAASAAVGTTVGAGAKLELAGGITVPAERLDLYGTLLSQTGVNTYSGAVWVQPGARFEVGPGSSLYVSGSTQINGSNDFSKTGPGLLRFTADPNHRGVCTVSEGTLELQHTGSTDAPFAVDAGATLRLNSGAPLGNFRLTVNGTLDALTSDDFNGLNGTGTVTRSAAGTSIVTVGNGGESGAFSGVIQNGAGTIGITKTGAGVQTLSGDSTYSGGTTNASGQLNINNGGSGGTSSAIGTGPFTISGGVIDNTSGAAVTLSPAIAHIWNGDFTFIGSKSLNLGTGSVTLRANRTVTVLTNSLTVGGAVSGAFALTKNGAGTLNLLGANTHSGSTTVNGGTLLVNGSTVSSSAVIVNNGATLGGSGSITGTVTVAAGGILVPGGANAVGTLKLANATASALTLTQSALLFDLSNVAGTCDKIDILNAAGKLVLNGTNTVALSFPAGGAPAGTYTLMTCAGGITTNAGAALVLQGAYPNVALGMDGNNLVLTVTGDGVAGVTWTGAASSNWDNGELNWSSNGVDSVAFPAGAAATFDDTAAGNFSIGSVGTVSPASVLFNNSANDYAVAATLSGTAPLVKQGVATATLSGNLNAYNPAALAVNNGILVLGGASQLNGGTYAGDILNHGALSSASSSSQTLSGTIAGVGALTKFGNGTLTLSGSNFFGGATIINAGTLKAQHAYALGATGSGTTVALGGTLEIAGNISTLGEALALYGTLSSQTGTNTFNGGINLYSGASIDVGTNSMLILKAFSANGYFTKTGNGWLKFTTDPNGVGTMTVAAGVAELAATTMDANVVVNAGTILLESTANALNDAARVTVNAGGTYKLNQSDAINGLLGGGTVTRDIAGASTLTVNNSTGQAYTFSGVMENGSGTLGFTKSGYGYMTLSGVNTYTGATTVNGGTLLVDSPGSLAAGSAVTVTATLGGSGAVSGPVTVNAVGFLMPGGLGTIGTLTLGSTLALNGGTLLCDLPATGTTCDRVAVAGALTLNGVTTVVLSFPDGATPAGDYTLMTFASRSGVGPFVLACNYPNAELVLEETSLILRVSGGTTSALTWNGNVSSVWDGGALNWLIGSTASAYATGNAVTFGDAASSFTVTSGGAVSPAHVFFNNNVNAYNVTAPINGMAPLVKFGMGTATLSGTAYNPASVTVGAGTLSMGAAGQFNGGTHTGNIVNAGVLNHASTAAQTLSGVISGVGSLTKTGSGSLTLTGTNTFSGGMTVSAGTLYGKLAPAAFGTGQVTLNGGGTLELQNDLATTFNNPAYVNGTTTVKAGRVTAQAGVTHAMGTLSIGNQTMTVSAGANVNNNTPYGLTFGTVTLRESTPTFTVNNNGIGNGTLALGALNGNYNLTKNGAGTLFLGTGSGRAGGTTTLTAGTLKLGNAAGLGTTASALQLNGGVLDLANDTSVNAYNTTVGGNTIVQSDKATANSAGITHTLGTLSIGAFTLTVTNGANVRAHAPFGLTFGATTLSGNAAIDVGNNASGLGTLTLQGAVSGGYSLTKRGSGTLKLAGVNTYSGGTTVNNGKLLGVSGGSCAGTVTLQSSGFAHAVAKVGVLCNAANGRWSCSNLTVSAASAPAVTNAVLEFAFGVAPSVSAAPLLVNGTVSFTATPSVTVNLSNLGTVSPGTYPLLTMGTASTQPALGLYLIGGYSGSSLSWSGDGKTLNLVLTGTPTASSLTWSSGAAGTGTWNINVTNNTVWTDSAAVQTCYAESPESGVAGPRVLFNDAYISTNTTVALNTAVTPTSVAFTNTLYGYTLTGSGAIAGAVNLVKAGSNVLTLATANTYAGGTTVAEGTLNVASGGVINHAGSDLVVAATALTNALLKIEGGAAVSGKWLMLGSTTGSVGAVHNRGTLVVAGAANVNNFALGFSTNGYGYYRHDTAIPLTVLETGIASASGGNGVFDVLQGAVTNSTYFQLNRGAIQQYSQVNVTGGRLVMPNSNANAHFFYAGSGQAVINVSGGGLLGSAGTGTELDLIKASTSTAANGILNVLAGGTVQATKVKASRGEGTALVNFNGGTFKANNNGFLMLGGSNIDRATVYTQGVTVDTDGKSATISQALLAPAGNGVTSIPVTASGTGYIGRPVVTISGGGGVGATAVADYDPDSQEVTGVTVTSPGYNYTSVPTVAMSGGGGIVPTLGAATFAPQPSGGLTKIGGGTLTLSGVNTYGGETTISNGTLRLGSVNTLPTNAIVRVAGGTLDLNGFTVTNALIDLISGAVVNGKVLAPNLQGADTGLIQAQIVSTNGLTKDGDTLLTIAVPQTYAGDTVINDGTVRLVGRQPGLYEGRVNGGFELAAANPKTATPLSARYAYLVFNANGESGNIWGDNTTYVYTGYLWNNSATSETWSFVKAFDDSARLLINGVNVLQNSTHNYLTISNVVMNPGPNSIELRLGQGTGGVGPTGTAGTSFTGLGIGYDRLGRGQPVAANYALLSDPGDGSLLTLTNLFDLANANILPTNSAVTVAGGALLDLGGTGQKVGGLSGSGVVSNGMLAVNGTTAPGGLLATGTLTLATSSATLSGTLRVDVSDDGTCDVLAVLGDVAFSSLALVVENVGQLNPAKAYTILTCTGARTGTFSSDNMPSGWVVSYEPNGDVKLENVGGTLFMLQ